MPLRHRRKARVSIPGLPEDCADGNERCVHASVADSPDQHQHKPLVDKFGNRHGESVLRNWSPQILRVLGMRRLDEKGGAR